MQFNDFLNTIFSSSPAVALMVAVLLDNTLDYKDSAKDRGMPWWVKFRTFKGDSRNEEFYTLPFNLNRFFPPSWARGCALKRGKSSRFKPPWHQPQHHHNFLRVGKTRCDYHTIQVMMMRGKDEEMSLSSSKSSFALRPSNWFMYISTRYFGFNLIIEIIYLFFFNCLTLPPILLSVYVSLTSVENRNALNDFWLIMAYTSNIKKKELRDNQKIL